MNTPFAYGKIVTDKNFTNRKKEIEHLVENFLSRVNTIIISPRRWGKSSLVYKAAQQIKIKDKTIKICFIDMFNIRSENEFYETLAQKILEASTSKVEEVLSISRKFMGNIIPKISVATDPNTSFSLGLDWKEVKKHPDEILNLSEKIAKAKKLKFVICIDEFQNISEFADSQGFQKKLRSHWQKHKNTSYCIYGSKRNMLLEVFSSQSMPFYKFGEIMILDKIEEKEWEKFIIKRFNETGKNITSTNALLISNLVESHPYYVQQLAQQAWLRTKKSCTEEIIQNAHQNLTQQIGLIFQTITDGLTSKQIQFLKAVLNEETKFSSQSNLKKYKLGTSANVLRLKQALVDKEILDLSGNTIQFLDPIYKNWLSTQYFI